MQKVVGSRPIIRFNEEPATAGLFSLLNAAAPVLERQCQREMSTRCREQVSEPRRQLVPGLVGVSCAIEQVRISRERRCWVGLTKLACDGHRVKLETDNQPGRERMAKRSGIKTTL